MAHSYSVDIHSIRYCRHGRQSYLGESRTPSQIIQPNQLPASHHSWVNIYTLNQQLIAMIMTVLLIVKVIVMLMAMVMVMGMVMNWKYFTRKNNLTQFSTHIQAVSGTVINCIFEAWLYVVQCTYVLTKVKWYTGDFVLRLLYQVFAMDLGNRLAVSVWIGKTLPFRSRPIHKPALLLLSGPDSDPYPSPGGYCRVCKDPSVTISSSAFWGCVPMVAFKYPTDNYKIMTSILHYLFWMCWLPL